MAQIGRRDPNRQRQIEDFNERVRLFTERYNLHKGVDLEARKAAASAEAENRLQEERENVDQEEQLINEYRNEIDKLLPQIELEIETQSQVTNQANTDELRKLVLRGKNRSPEEQTRYDELYPKYEKACCICLTIAMVPDSLCRRQRYCGAESRHDVLHRSQLQSVEEEREAERPGRL